MTTEEKVVYLRTQIERLTIIVENITKLLNQQHKINEIINKRLDELED